MQGRVIGPYEVGDLIGRGGMGEVFRARDTRLERDVALKILPEELAKDPERLARFEREAKVLASLQHQNIAAIYGIEQVDGTPVLVMELAEGEDLSQRMLGGALPADEVQRIAHQLAKGLEFAHEHSIVHRDLKPANVKVGEDGRVKILDFGLARALTSDGNSSMGGDAFQATITQGLTGTGAVLGTAAYMSPEQARGYEVDRRSDIWAFGVILFEMLSGRRLFAGETATDTLAAVLRKDPEWDALPEDVPPLLDQICRRCLERDPRQRLRDIGEVRIALDGGASSVLDHSFSARAALSGDFGSPRPPRWVRPVIGALVVALAAMGYLAFSGRLGPGAEPLPLVRSVVPLSEGIQLGLNATSPGPVTVSPDGKRLVFAAVDSLAQTTLFLRDLDAPEVRKVSGTQGAGYPFWSMDSRSVGFFNGNDLRRLDVAGGPIITVCQAENGKGGSWNSFDEILFAPSHVSSIHLVAATGGEPRPVTGLADQPNARSHRFPHWLPDGEHFLYLAVNRGGGSTGNESILRLGHKNGMVDRELMPCQANAAYSAGHILFVHDQILMARPFSVDNFEFRGPAFPVLEDVLTLGAAHCAVFSASDAGVLAFTRGEGIDTGPSVLQLLEPEGEDIRQLGQPLLTFGIAFGPQGKRVALVLPDLQIGTFDIWLYEVERDLQTRLTSGSETENFPIWSPDGQWIYYSTDAGKNSNIYRYRVTGAGRPELVFPSDKDCFPSSISPDGATLAYSVVDSTGKFDIGLCDLTGDTAPRLFRDSNFGEGRAVFSPDGNWLAYVSDETGNAEIFIEGLQPDSGRYRVSSGGGVLPLWSPGGDAIYYLTEAGLLMVTEVIRQGNSLGFGHTSMIYQGVEGSSAATAAVDPVSGNLLVQKSSQNQLERTLALVTGWTRLLDRGKE